MPVREATEASLLHLMFGDYSPSVSEPRLEPNQASGEVVLELDRIAIRPAAGAVTLRDLCLTVCGGEILGVAGVSGNGQRELAECILGLRRPTRGARRLSGKDATAWSAARIRESGVASIPDDPLGFAIVPSFSVRENLALGGGRRYHSRIDLDWRRIASDMEQSRTHFNFPPLPFETSAAALSGGNQQRLVLTRELAHGSKLIIALYPTQGLDARSTEDVRAVFNEARAAGAAVLLVSEDLDELFALSDRLIVLRGGRIAGPFARSSFDVATIGPCMVGGADAT
jgi:simple sugar transport system ATP-binding protein